MNFLETYNRLAEIYSASYDDTSNKMFYHGYSSFTDLINSLNEHRIYSDKNQKGSQFDRNAYYKEQAYVCFTTQGYKKTLVKLFNRPFMIGFLPSKLQDLCNQKGYEFNPNEEYNQVETKFSYERQKRSGRPTISSNNKDIASLVTALHDLEIFAIGELTNTQDNKYFISIGQGPAKCWSARQFNDPELYNTLKNWFIESMNTGTMKKGTYWFKDNNLLGDLSKCTKIEGHIVNTTANLNKYYEPRYNSKDPTKYDGTIEFQEEFSLPFKEIIGWGPIRWDKTKLNPATDLVFIAPTTKRGWVGPRFFGKEISDDGTVHFEDTPKIVNGNNSKFGIAKHLVADKATATAIADLFSEEEFRVYTPTQRDMYFTAADVSNLVLPGVYINVGDTIDFNVLIDLLINNQNLFALDDFTLLNQQFIDTNVVLPKVKKHIKLDTLKLLSKFIKFLITDGAHLNVEVDGTSKIKSGNLNAVYTKYKEHEILDTPHTKNGDHSRYLISTKPDLAQAHLVKGFTQGNHKTVLAPVEIGGQIIDARIGSEVLITAKDADGNKYVLVVARVDKSDSFVELPGGGFDTPSDSPEDVAKQRLSFKAGLDLSKVTNLTDTNKAIFLYEKGVAKTDEVLWNGSYYYLFTAEYTELIDETNLDSKYKNDEYTAFTRWLRLDSIDFNDQFMSRYFRLKPYLK